MSQTDHEKQSDINLLIFNALELPERYFKLSSSVKRKLIYSGFIKTGVRRPGVHYAELTPLALTVMKKEHDEVPIITTLSGKTRSLRRK